MIEARLELFGCPFAVSGDDRAIISELMRAIPLSETAELPAVNWSVARSDHHVVVTDESGATAAFWTVEQAVHYLAGQIQVYAAEHTTAHVAIHAGVIAVAGRGILLPGKTCSGKSTLVAECLRQGATYYSDEYALLDREGRVHPYARPLRMRRASGDASLVDPLSIAETVAVGPARPVVIAALEYKPNTDWSVTTLRPAESALLLMQNAIPARRRTADVLDRCASVAHLAMGVRGTRGEAADAARMLLQLLDGPSADKA